MPIPFIIAGVAIAAGTYGVKKGIDAKDDYDTANSIKREAEDVYDDAKDKLEKQRDKTQKAIKSLGTLKFNTFEESIIPFIDSFTKIKKIDNSISVNGKTVSLPSKEVLNAMVEHNIELKEIIGGGITSLGAGGLAGLAAYGSVGTLATASTGTAIAGLSGAAATNATLAWLGGGSIASGGLGMGGGAAVLGGIVAGPVLAVGGMMLASKAEEEKHNAYTQLDEAKIAAEEMKTATTTARGINKKVVELSNIISKLNENFEELIVFVKSLVKKNIDFTTYSNEEIDKLYIAYQHYETLNNLLNVTLLTKKGNLTKKVKDSVKANKNILVS